MMRIVGLVALLLAACAEHAVVYPGPPELVLGIGDAELVPIEDGDPVPITTGPQGGTIVWGAASVRYLDPVQLELVFSITPPEGRASLRRVLVDLDGAEGGFASSTTLGHMVFLPYVELYSGLPCVWRLEARDRAGRVAIDERTIVPTLHDPP
jgi:hypothetical protein